MAFNEFPFLRYAVFFILGIVIYPWIEFVDIFWIIILYGSIFLLYLIFTLYTSYLNEFKNRLLISFLGLTLWVIFGLLLSYSKDVKRDTNHLLYKDNYEGYIGIVQQNDEIKPRTLRNTIRLTHVANNDSLWKAEGEVIIYHQSNLAPGQVVAIKGKPQRVAPPNNPYEFDYAQFLSRQQIYHTHFAGKNITVLGWVNHRPINFFFLSLRKIIQDQMNKVISHPRANQIAQALLLGQKNNLDREVSEAYSTAGAMHILAVSGLHVGIIYGFFFVFFRPYKLSPYKRMAYLSMVIIIIWTYAFLTGMSPSVMRSATMFTIISMAQMRSSSPSVYNGLAISAILLLVYDPNLIYAVGFQLSYAALTGILLFQPVIVNLWLPKNKLLYRCWEITSVGIAAQLATFPISAYYFHTFPTYFILSNLIAIPGAFVIMAIGIPFMLFSIFPWIGEGLGLVLDYLIQILNKFIFLIHDLPAAKVTAIRIEPWEIVWYYSLLALTFILVTARFKKLTISLISVILLGVCVNWANLMEIKNKKEIYLYTATSGRAVDHIYGQTLYSWNDGWADQDILYKIIPNRINVGIHSQTIPLHFEPDQGVLILPDEKFISTKERVEFINFSPKEVSCFDGKSWHPADQDSIMWNDNKAYRIIVE
ncbi:MAG TPA: ComEC/Rec2 family competence protein [Anditalea sp.]|nr:ComEC/Rec2 family competence protein [Anditalea sp.]